MPAARSICLFPTSVRPVGSSSDKSTDDIDGDSGNDSDECAASQCFSLEGIFIVVTLYCENTCFFNYFFFKINSK